MNEVVPDWLHREDTTRASSTAVPNTTIYFDNDVELSALRRTVALLQDENRALKAELREKCMTRFERIKNAPNADAMAQMLHKFYLSGASDYMNGAKWDDLDSVEDISQYLQEIGNI